MQSMYTAKTFHLNKQIHQDSSNELDYLMIRLITHVEDGYSGTRGLIIHNPSKKILQTCRKSFIE